MPKATPKYQRILLKLSGEALGKNGIGIDPSVLDRMALEIGQLERRALDGVELLGPETFWQGIAGSGAGGRALTVQGPPHATAQAGHGGSQACAQPDAA